MILDSVVVDRDTGERLPNATVRISNDSGGTLTGGVYANENGQFSIDVPETGFLAISYAGYKTAVFPVSLILQSSGAGLERSDSSTLEPVVVTAKKMSWGIVLVAALLVAAKVIKK